MGGPTEPDDLPLFRDTPLEGFVPPVPPWRPSPADGWEGKPPSPRLQESHYPDLLRRDLEFLMALERSGISRNSPRVRRFRERHRDLVEHLVRWREAKPDSATAAETARLALGAVEELADLRRRILEELEPARQRSVLAAESRARVPGHEVERAIAMAELERAEARGDVVEIELPASAEPLPPAGFVGADALEALLRGHMEGMRAEQERRPLPAQGRLATLLRQIPAVWLDATWEALGLGPDQPAQRKEREKRIARHLVQADTLGEIVEEKLSTEERQLLAYLLEKGGRVASGSVTRRFGRDRDDGWFWNEEPPTSALGRLRLHGLAFVGTDATSGRPTRTVLVPRGLREGLREALGAHETAGPSEAPEARTDRRAEDLREADLRGDVFEALEVAFPDGIVDLVGDEAWLTERLTELADELASLPGGRLLYQRTPEGGWRWSDGVEIRLGNESGWEGAGYDEERSYGLFFLTPAGDDFRFEFESDFPDEHGRLRPTTGIGQIGYAVAVSTLAPFALIRLTSLDVGEEVDAVVLPDIPTRYFDDPDEPGRPLREEGFLREMLEKEAREALDDLRDGIVAVLGSFGIARLPEEEARKPVPWLEPNDGVPVGTGTVTVEDALFFRVWD